MFRAFKIKSFSSMHRPHLLWPGLHGGIFFMIPHLIWCGLLLLFSCQMYLESSVSFWYLVLLMDFVWFRNLVLNSLAVTPMYVFVSLLSVVVISALYTTLVWRQSPCIGQSLRFLQLQRRESFVRLVVFCLSCFCSIVLLCRLMKDFIFSLQL